MEGSTSQEEVGGDRIEVDGQRPAPRKTTTAAAIPALLGRPSTRELMEMERRRWRSSLWPSIYRGRSVPATAHVGVGGSFLLLFSSPRDAGGAG